MALPDSGDTREDSRELVRGLMRGNREELKLGYSAANATIAAARHYSIDDRDELTDLAMYAAGFAEGMGLKPHEHVPAFTDGVSDGGGEPRDLIHPAKGD